jgi:hypothetical protein
MRKGLQTQFLGHRRHLFQERDDPAIILPLVRFEHQQGEQLMLREFVRTVAMAVKRKNARGGLHRFPNHRTWRLGCEAHVASSTDAKRIALPNMRRTSNVFYRAFASPLIPSQSAVLRPFTSVVSSINIMHISIILNFSRTKSPDKRLDHNRDPGFISYFSSTIPRKVQLAHPALHFDVP